MNEIIESHVRAVYRLLNHGSGLSDCRCIDVNKPGSPPVSRELLRGEDQFLAWARRNNGKGNCFVGRNPRKADGTVSQITSYSLDLDPPHPPRTAVPRELMQRAVMAGRVALQKWPGGYLAESGNGSLVVYRLAVPCSQDLETFKRWLIDRGDEVQRVLAAGGLGDITCDKTHDNERIIKIPGTLSVKGERDNWRVARFVELPTAPYRCVEWGKVAGGPVAQPARKGNPAGWITDALKDLAPGNRDNTFTRIAGRLWYDRWGMLDIKALLLPHALRVGFAEQDLDRVLRSVGNYAQPTGTAKGGVAVKAQSIDEFCKGDEKVDWFCQPIFARQAIALIAGLGETMKTWTIVDLAVECAAPEEVIKEHKCPPDQTCGMCETWVPMERKWLGLFPVKSAKVLFVEQERQKAETVRRITQVAASKGLTIDDLKGRLFVRAGHPTQIDDEDSFQAFRSELAEIKPDIVIIDSFSTFHGKNENNKGEIQFVFERIKSLYREFNCGFIFIDHENKYAFDDAANKVDPSAVRVSGNAAKVNAADHVLTVRRFDAISSSVFHTKNNLGPKVGSFVIRVTNGKNKAIHVTGEL